MQRKIIKLLKVIAIICVIILIIELIYIFYLLRGKSVYFDGINSLINTSDGVVAVGSNNNNDRYLERAKLTKYDEKKNKVFEKIYNKGYNGVFFDVCEDGDNLIAVGSYEATKEEHATGNRSAAIVMYDSTGNLLYENDFQMLGNSKFTSVVAVSDGYIVTGSSVYENMMVGLSEEGGALLMKYNKELELVWKKNLGDSKTAVYNDAVVYEDYIYAVGLVDSLFGVVAKYDLEGNLITSTKYQYTDNLGFTGVIESNNSLFVTAGKKKEVDNSECDAVIVQYGLSLEFQKEVIYDDGAFERYNQIVSDDYGNLIAIGTSSTLNKNDSVAKFIHDGIVGKYDKDLEKIVIVNYGDERDDYLTDIITYGDDYLITGYSSYEDGSYLSKFITYSNALKILGVE